jgi:malic enzyme
MCLNPFFFVMVLILQDIRAITARIAAEVIKQAAAEGNADAEAMEVVAGSDARLVDWVRRHMWTPKYNSVAYLPPGIGE